MSRQTAGTAATRTAATKTAAPPEDYLHRSELPLASLAFLLPLIVLYEVGTWRYAPEQRIIAFSLLQDFFGLFGATGRHLPALAVVGILLAWHVARQDAWRVRAGTLAGMTIESIVLVLPLLGASMLSAYYLPLYASWEDWQGLIVLSIGAGIYEELVFRLIGLTLLHLLLCDLLRIPRLYALPLMVIVSAVVFSGYHYLGPETFAWRSFLFRTAAGVYFAAIFLVRGFGITAGAHAAYDVAIVCLITWFAEA